MRFFELREWDPRARDDRRTRGDAFQTVAVKRTYACEIKVERMASRVDMTDLRMHEAVNRCAVHQHAAADSGADGEIHESFDVSRRTPSVFGQSSRIDVGIETDGAGEFARQGARNIGAGPSRLRSSADETVTGGGLIEFHGTERGDADRCERAERLSPLPQEGLRGRERRGRVSGGKAFLREDFAAVVADGANELGAAGFDTTKKTWHTDHGLEE